MKVEIKKEHGTLFSKENYMVVKKVGDNSEIKKHYHPNQDVVFSVIKGNVEVKINEKEEYSLNQGDVLNFDGDNSISAKFIGEGEVVIVLINRKKEIQIQGCKY